MYRRFGYGLAGLLFVSLSVIGCAQPGYLARPANHIEIARAASNPPSLVATSYLAADRLIDNLQADLQKTKPILVASVVNVDDLEKSSTFGRIISEQIGSRLAQRGYLIKELKLRNSFLIKNKNGEFILSRDLMDIGREQDAQAVVAGTYAAGSRVVYVSIRLISVADARIVSSHDYVLSMGRTLDGLIEKELASRPLRRPAVIDLKTP